MLYFGHNAIGMLIGACNLLLCPIHGVQASTKLMVIVKMLLGNIPTRDVFRTEALRRSLIPYFELTQAVRIGDLSKFSSVIDKYGTHARKNVGGRVPPPPRPSSSAGVAADPVKPPSAFGLPPPPPHTHR